MGKIRPVNADDQLSVVEHLDELRTRIIVVLAFFSVVLAVCFWRNHDVLTIVNSPLPEGLVPATFGVSEAFMATLTVSAYAALIITSPLIVYEIWAFVVPALSSAEKRVARPMVVLTPLLFAGGCLFGYFIVLPAALGFLLSFNEEQFNMLLRASEYYSFFGLTVLTMGVLFELPLAILIAARLGVVTSDQLRQNRRYAVLVIAVVAMLLPGVDPVSMLIEMVPLLLLFELSVWLTVWFGDPRRPAEATSEGAVAGPDTAMR